MSLFRRRCAHTWEIRMRRSYTVREKWAWEQDWVETGEETIIHYVCSTCKDDTSRTVEGRYTVEQAKMVFPKP